MSKKIPKASFRKVFNSLLDYGSFSYPLIKCLLKNNFVEEKEFFNIIILFWERKFSEVIENIEKIFSLGVFDNRKKFLLYCYLMKTYYNLDKNKSRIYFVLLADSFNEIPLDIRNIIGVALKSHSSLDPENKHFKIWGKSYEEEENTNCFYKISLARNSQKNRDFLNSLKYYSQALRAAFISNHHTGIITAYNNFHYLMYEKFPKNILNFIEHHKYYIAKTNTVINFKLFNIETIFQILDKNEEIEKIEILMIADYYLKKSFKNDKFKFLKTNLKNKLDFNIKRYNVDNDFKNFLISSIKTKFSKDKHFIRLAYEDLKYTSPKIIQQLLHKIKIKKGDKIPFPFMNEMIKLNKKNKALNILNFIEIDKIQFLSAFFALLDKKNNFFELTKNIVSIYNEFINDKNNLIKRVNNNDYELAYMISLIDKSDGFYKAHMEYMEIFLKNIKQEKLNEFILKYLNSSHFEKDSFDEFVKNYSIYYGKFEEYDFIYDENLENFCNYYGLDKHSALLSFYCFDNKSTRALNKICKKFYS
jgi:hypothetical protein